MPSPELKQRLARLYRQYDHRFVVPDPLEFVRAQRSRADREIVGLLASCLAFGTVGQMKKSIAAVLAGHGPRPAETVARLERGASRVSSCCSGCSARRARSCRR